MKRLKKEAIGYIIWLMVGVLINVFTDDLLALLLLSLWVCGWLYCQVVFEWSLYRVTIKGEGFK